MFESLAASMPVGGASVTLVFVKSVSVYGMKNQLHDQLTHTQQPKSLHSGGGVGGTQHYKN